MVAAFTILASACAARMEFVLDERDAARQQPWGGTLEIDIAHAARQLPKIPLKISLKTVI